MLDRGRADTQRGVLTLSRFDELASLGEPLHLALGVFDGVHRGHQAVIAAAVEAARQEGGMAGLLTFEPHPIRVIAPAKAPSSLLETLEHKARFVKTVGVEVLVALRFDRAMAAMEAADFIDRLTAAPVRSIAVGEDWRFGRERAGDVAMLRSEATVRGYKLLAVPPVMWDGDRISSTRIRQAIHDGNLSEAAEMLGRPYVVTGTVVPGDQRGRQLGFPTANVDTGSLQLPPPGVWSVRALVPGKHDRWLDGVANLGSRPTVGGGHQVLEVHLINYSADLYGKNLELRFVEHLRPEIRFPSLEALSAQISCDLEAAKHSLAQSAGAAC